MLPCVAHGEHVRGDGVAEEVLGQRLRIEGRDLCVAGDEAHLLEQRGPDSATLRQIRAVEVLEHVGSPDSRALLESLAQGDPDARLTIDAKDSLARLSKP